MPHPENEESYPMQLHSTSIDSIVILNPKLYKDPKRSKESRIFPYYAGYSSEFSNNLLSTLGLSRNAIIFDPWNGSGTTTRSAFTNGFDSIGFDLNPSMILVAKARLLSPLEHPSLVAIATSLVEQARITISSYSGSKNDPLLKWFSTCGATPIRVLESKINHLLISSGAYLKLDNNEAMDLVSPLAAFFYVSLFRTVRKLLIDFIPSNPTWVKHPKTKLNRKRPTLEHIFETFIEEVKILISRESSFEATSRDTESSVKLQIGNAEDIFLKDNSVDAIISSPPYCTRIDYAVSTTIELAVIRCEQREFDVLRRCLTGTSTVERTAAPVDKKWGDTCVNFLDSLYSHPSRASKGYYFKNHLQYFGSLSRSLGEIARVLKPGKLCFLVVQDSYYKEIHNDVPLIASEMANAFGLKIARREDFRTSRSMVGVNLNSKKYLKSRNTTESVLCFQKN
ncbi:DNA methylase [Pseudomonas syringae]|uniref:Site-specific DNA-methyltransferase n=2 Tax=Pseudomonas syringae TaxID=317 RepID=A0A6B2B300_PSESX|nr:site-specific DNA-methyltransferase [Pseudomonas syringae]NAO44289.1 site-specific DNA-methyltransferase [Pseudomonas syringae]NAO49053.1 site-specific DNA-methyltransferase [Pseudomonas syringae]NAO62805.1 site-specific DNA-methyltransferase [Pseudomonas syringae]NAO67881.1 site-specific DNA-methyltransferase [Pseudomonas syringae]